MADNQGVWLERQTRRIERRLQLLRGHMLGLRGAHLGSNFGLGRGAKVEYPHCLYTGDQITIEDYAYMHCLSEHGVHISSFTSIDRNLWLHCGGRPGDCGNGFFEIGEHSYIGCNAVIGAGGGIRIGNYVLVGQSVNMHAEQHRFADTNRLICEQGVSYRSLVIEDDVWVGSKVTILTGVTIGRGAVIGAGSVVTRDIAPYSVAVGVPAKVIRSRKRGL